MNKHDDLPSIESVVAGYLALTAGMSKKKACCCPPSQAIQLVNELHEAAVGVLERYADAAIRRGRQ